MVERTAHLTVELMVVMLVGPTVYSLAAKTVSKRGFSMVGLMGRKKVVK
jgi:hypothetical protein